MANFVIDGQEYELKLNYAGVKYLNAIYPNGSFEVIGKAMMGDLDTFPHVISAALKHTGRNFSLATIEAAIDDQMASEQLDLDAILRISNEVVTKSFFYAKTVAKLTKDNKQAQQALEKLLS